MPNNVQVQQRPASVLGIQSALTCVSSRTLTVPAGSTHAVIDNSSQVTIRYRLDSGTPTAAVGNRLAPGASLVWTDPSADYSLWITGFRAIQEASAGTMEVCYMTYGSNP